MPMLVNDPVLISMIEELTDKYNKMQDFLIDDEPCIDIVRSVYELECTVSEFKKELYFNIFPIAIQMNVMTLTCMSP
ncbi:hypothetical protein AB6T93_30655 [Klebsiella pneumoniae]